MDQNIVVRTIRKDDVDKILAIRNADDVRVHSRNSEKVSDEEHRRWFTEQMKPQNRERFFVVTREKEIIGYIRYDLRENYYDISVAVENRFRKLGVGSLLLKSSLPKMEQDGRLIKAGVKRDNLQSLKFFEKNGFHHFYEDEGYIYYLWPRIRGPIVIATSHVWDKNMLPKLEKRIDRNVIVLHKKEQLEKERLGRLKPSYVFFPHWSWIIPDDIWQNYRCIVFHMTDLPFGRGGSPLQNLIIRGFTETKISAIAVNDIVDGGPIYLKRKLSLSGNAERIYRRAFRTILLMIEAIVKKNPKPTKQAGKVVLFKRRTPDQSRLPETKSLGQLYDFIRMLDAEGYPKAFLDHGDFLLSFSNAKIRSGEIGAHVTIRKKKDEKN